MKQFFCSVALLLTMMQPAAAQQVVERDYHINVENGVVAKYMAEVDYEIGDSSVIQNYQHLSNERKDIPTPVVMELPETDADSLWIVCYDEQTLADSLTFHVRTATGVAYLYNFIPQRTYRYEVTDNGVVKQQGRIFTDGQLRMINVAGTVRNVRDLGGWATEDGKRIKYGRIFRGSELNNNYVATSEGIDMLLELGVGAEIDMRAWYNEGRNTSVFGFLNSANTPTGQVPTFYYSSDSGQVPQDINNYNFTYRWRNEFNFIVNNLQQQRGIYEHCVLGRDRTSYLSLLLEGILGVSYSDIIKDHELSYFTYITASKKDSIDKVINFIMNFEGETLRDKFNTYFTKKLLVSQSDIDYFRSVMLEDAVLDNDDDDENDGDDDKLVTRIETPRRAAYPTASGPVLLDLNGHRLWQPRKGMLCLEPDGRGGYRKTVVK